MGFWSKLCVSPGCGHPLLCVDATDEVNQWMSQAVAIDRDGSMNVGEYDGYGRVGGAEDALASDDVTVWHRSCWELAGRPIEFTVAAEYAPDQGWFFDKGDHDVPDPLTQHHGDQLGAATSGVTVRGTATGRIVVAKPPLVQVEREWGRDNPLVIAVRQGLLSPTEAMRLLLDAIAAGGDAPTG